jgi:hypothetical protein
MNPESSLKIQELEKFPVVMTKEKVAEALGIATHNIPPLVRSGLLKPLGHPGRYCVKHFSRDALAQQLADMVWLNKVVTAIHRHWRIKNARKRTKQAGNGMAQPNGNPMPTSAGRKTSSLSHKSDRGGSSFPHHRS